VFKWLLDGNAAVAPHIPAVYTDLVCNTGAIFQASTRPAQHAHESGYLDLRQSNNNGLGCSRRCAARSPRSHCSLRWSSERAPIMLNHTPAAL